MQRQVRKTASAALKFHARCCKANRVTPLSEGKALNHKTITAVMASGALLLSAAGAAAADYRPANGDQTVAAAKAPVTGVRGKRAVKKGSNALPAFAIALIAVGVAGGVAGGIVAATSSPSSP